MIDLRPRFGVLAVLVGGLALACSNESAEDLPSELRQSVTQEVALWTRLPITASAAARAFHGAVYEPSLNGILVFGGRDGQETSSSLGDTGLANGAAWVGISSPYARRGYVRGAFDSSRARVVTYGGLNVGLVTGVSHFSETWEFGGADSTWTLRSATSLPGRRSGYGLAYDSRRQVTVLFGGFDRNWKDDVYEWNGSTWAKACTSAACSAAPRPSERASPVFVYDDARGVSLLFGGNGAKGLLGDTWSWDGELWQLLKPAVSPAPRDSSAATYDPVSRRVLLFGGAFADSREAGDFWAWDGADWARIAQTTTPLNRRGGGLVWDVERRRGVLLGGVADGGTTDAWTFVLSGGPCDETEQCHVGTCVRGTCSSPTVDGGAGGAGDDLGEGGTAGGQGGGASGGTAGPGTSGMSSGAGGSALGGGGVPVTEGNATGDGDGPGGSRGGTTLSGGDGAAGSSPSTAGAMQGLRPGAPEETKEKPRQSFYACGIGSARRSRGAVIVFAPLVLLAFGRARKRRRRSGPAAPPR